MEYLNHKLALQISRWLICDTFNGLSKFTTVCTPTPHIQIIYSVKCLQVS